MTSHTVSCYVNYIQVICFYITDAWFYEWLAIPFITLVKVAHVTLLVQYHAPFGPTRSFKVTRLPYNNQVKEVIYNVNIYF